ncbi:MAG: cytochrome c-type biogenesis protein CcmH [Candidatus Eisenbacteria bacterium]
MSPRCARRALAVGGFVLASLLAAPFGVTQVLAADASAVEAVSRELMDPCENCKGKLLSACDCGPAAELKAEVAKLLDQGIAPKAVVEQIVAEKGEWVRSAPKKSGFNLVGYVLPFVLIVAGAGALLLFLRRAVRPSGGASSRRSGPEARGVQSAEPLDSSAIRTISDDATVESGLDPAEEARYRQQLERELARMGK